MKHSMDSTKEGKEEITEAEMRAQITALADQISGEKLKRLYWFVENLTAR